jgi:hypothetical protein
MWRFNVPGKNCLLEKTNQVDFFIGTYLVGPPKLPRRVYTHAFITRVPKEPTTKYLCEKQGVVSGMGRRGRSGSLI